MRFNYYSTFCFIFLLMLGNLFLTCDTEKKQDKESMKEEELAKLDPMLQRVIKTDGDVPDIIGYTIDDEGVQWFSVVIRTSDINEIKEFGIRTGAQVGNMITAQVTREQIYHLVRLESVEYIEAGMVMELQ